MKKINRRTVFNILAMAAATFVADGKEALGKDVPSSTFVGNGGDAQDLDLGVTLAVISNLGKSLSKAPTDTLCRCSDEWQENDICRVLRQMSKEEVNACRQIIQRFGAEIADLAGRKSPVTFQWSYNNISVQSQAQKSRPVDAVTQTNKQKIIINRSRFQSMPPSYRVALLTHEIFHLVRFDNGYISDDQPAPPFANGRVMLNALGAAVAMEANEQEVYKEFKGLSEVSRSSKNHRLYLESRSVRHKEQTSNQLLKGTSSGGVGFGYALEQGSLGVGFSGESLYYDEFVYGTVRITEKISIYHINASYRLHPVNSYLSRWNEMYLQLSINAGSGRAEYKAASTYVTKNDSSGVSSVGTSLRLNIPLVRDLWIVTGGEFRQVRYDYKKLRIKTIENQSVLTFGGAYGF